MVRLFVPFVMSADQQREHARQKHENQSLNQTDQHF
jgi:hypothetical protein